MRRFTDRRDAGRRLVEPVVGLLAGPGGPGPGVTLVALPRGGVVVAAALQAGLADRGHPVGLTVLPVTKVRHPDHPEVALGAVTRDRLVRTGPVGWTGTDDVAFARLTDTARHDLARRTAALPAVEDPGRRAALVVDDGLATGATAEVAIAQLRHDGVGWVGVAVPVAEPRAWARILAVADGGVTLLEPRPLHSVGSHYRDFTQVSDDEVRAALRG